MMRTVDADQRDSLIQSGSISSFDSDRHGPGNINNLEQLVDNKQERPNRSIWVLTFAAGVSGLLFGYEYVLT